MRLYLFYNICNIKRYQGSQCVQTLESTKVTNMSGRKFLNMGYLTKHKLTLTYYVTDNQLTFSHPPD